MRITKQKVKKYNQTLISSPFQERYLEIIWSSISKLCTGFCYKKYWIFIAEIESMDFSKNSLKKVTCYILTAQLWSLGGEF